MGDGVSCGRQGLMVGDKSMMECRVKARGWYEYWDGGLCVIEPDSGVLLCWNVLMVLMIVYNLL